MRIFIIGLSIIFFILSGLITYRALEIPDYNFSYKSKPEKPVARETTPETFTAPEPVAQDIGPEELSDPESQATEQNANQVPIDQMKAANIEQEETPAVNKKEIVAVDETKEPAEKVQVLAVLGGGTFQSGQVVVSDSLISSVNELVQSISASPGHHVVIEGHTDNEPIHATPGKQYQDNMDLSFLRAKAIARILIEKGISRERISVVGYGDTRPVASNDSDTGRAKNRRVEVKLVPGEREF